MSRFFPIVYIAVLFGLKRDENILLEGGGGGGLRGFKVESLAGFKANYLVFLSLVLNIKSGLMIKLSFFLGYSTNCNLDFTGE